VSFTFNRALRTMLGGAFLAAAVPFTAAAAINDFYGQWANSDPAASSVHSVSIWHSEEGLQIQVFGCFTAKPAILSEEPLTNCDWGKAEVHVYSNSMNAESAGDVHVIAASFNGGSAKRQLLLQRSDGGRLRFEMFVHFTDESRRSDFFRAGNLTRVKDVYVPVTPR
jgi:hypothetical protein